MGKPNKSKSAKSPNGANQPKKDNDGKHKQSKTEEKAIEKEDGKKREKAKKDYGAITYNSTLAICFRVIIGIFLLVGCTVFGIALAQCIGMGCEKFILWITKADKFDNYFSDFLGGALGLTIGFMFDKICIEKINCVYKCRSFLSSVMHELDRIAQKDQNGKSKVTVVSEQSVQIGSEDRKDKTKVVAVEFNADGKIVENKTDDPDYVVLNNVDPEGNSIGLKSLIKLSGIRELIFDDVVTSAETMTIISDLPKATFKSDDTTNFKNKFIDHLGNVHRLICEYNEEVNRYFDDIEKYENRINALRKDLESTEYAKLNEVIKMRDDLNERLEKALKKRHELTNRIEQFTVKKKLKIFHVWELKK